MLVKVACPSCGGEGSESEPSKWTCLHCGSKFIFVPPSTPQAQNTVNAAREERDADDEGSTITIEFEFDSKESSNPPKTVPANVQAISGDSGYNTNDLGELVKRNQIMMTICLIGTVVFGFGAGYGITHQNEWLLCIAPMAVFIFGLAANSRDARKNEEILKQAGTKSVQQRKDFEAGK